eukprot:3080646-Prymnesium_polylepis.1
MVATVDEIRRRLSECGERPTPTQGEVESAANTRDLRSEDRAWVTRMYEEAHKRQGKKWAQHHT